MTKTVAEALHNLRRFQEILETEGQEAAVKFAASVVDDPEGLLDEDPQSKRPHLHVVDEA